jgi:hypothetical protein
MRGRGGLISALVSIAGVVLCLTPLTSAHHAVLRFNLEEMTQTADRIFVGRCVLIEETRDTIAQGVLPITRYTFEVERVIKGKLPKQFTFTQLGHAAPRAVGKGGEMTIHGRAVTPDSFIHGMTAYREGERYVLFLIPNYAGGKVTYPVGLYQGSFEVTRMPSGQEMVRNGINNLGLFTARYNGTKMSNADAQVIFPERDEPLASGIPLSEQSRSIVTKRGSFGLEPFLEMVDQINIAHQGARGEIVSQGKGAINQ